MPKDVPMQTCTSTSAGARSSSHMATQTGAVVTSGTSTAECR